MVDYELDDDGPNELRSRVRSFLIRDWPYLLMLTVALFGAAYTSADRPVMMLYWMVLGPLFGIICVVAHWRDYDDPEAHWELVRKQALHWTAVMFTMALVFAANVKQMMNADASALMVLALGDFVGVREEAGEGGGRRRGEGGRILGVHESPRGKRGGEEGMWGRVEGVEEVLYGGEVRGTGGTI